MPEAAGYKGLARLEVIRKLNARREWINYGLYKLLLDKDMYVLAYERMKSKPMETLWTGFRWLKSKNSSKR